MGSKTALWISIAFSGCATDKAVVGEQDTSTVHAEASTDGGDVADDADGTSDGSDDEGTGDTSGIDDTSLEDDTSIEDDTATDDPGYAACADEIEPALAWFDAAEVGSFEGQLDFGQTHVIREVEERHAPPLIEDRAAMYLLHSTMELPLDADARISAWQDGVLLGVLPLNAPDDLPVAVEQAQSRETLAPWSDSAWSAFLPYTWIQEGVELRAGVKIDGEVWSHSHILSALGAPQRFTISRSKMVLFGDPDKATDTQSAERITQDYFSTLPVADMRWVDSSPWRLDEIVVNTSSGPRLVRSEGERLETTSDPDRWNIIKHQFALRMNLANTGRGLTQNIPSDGDSSPYSFGTSVGSGWVMNDDGSYSDLDNAPYAAGWTGWTAMWLGECGNTFIHEIGHSATLAHFTSGTAVSWGVAEEYPLDGTHVEGHPWGFDTTREQFRTWYRVDDTGPVLSESGGFLGKNDPMNGGEAPTSSHCFPQYVPYHAAQIQRWSESSETIATVDDIPGVYRFNRTTREYDLVDLSADERQNPIAVDVPVATVIGTLGATPEARRIYPPMYWSSGNAFEQPNPLDEDLHAVYTGAQYFLTTTYGDGSTERALIAQPEITDENLFLFSLNIELDKDPTRIELWLSPTGYPVVNIDDAVSQFAIDVEEPTAELPEPVLVGRGHLPTANIQLNDWCETDFDCDLRYQDTTWRMGTSPIHFLSPDSEDSDRVVCSIDGDWTDLRIPVINETDETDFVIVRAQRIVQSGGSIRSAPIHDATPWSAGANMRQSLRAWIPYEENTHLGTGTWRSDGPYTLRVIQDGETIDQTNIDVGLQVYEAENIDLASDFEGPSYTTESSSTYFVVTDSAVGPISGVWWGSSDATPLTVPVRNVETGEPTHLNVNAWKRSCNLGWGTWWNLNSGQLAEGTCAQWIQLSIGENEHLESGTHYASSAAKPVIFRAMGWHAGVEIARDAYSFEYRTP